MAASKHEECHKQMMDQRAHVAHRIKELPSTEAQHQQLVKCLHISHAKEEASGDGPIATCSPASACDGWFTEILVLDPSEVLGA
eukprot:5183406-Pyramimonas_sp.AAC.1